MKKNPSNLEKLQTEYKENQSSTIDKLRTGSIVALVAAPVIGIVGSVPIGVMMVAGAACVGTNLLFDSVVNHASYYAKYLKLPTEKEEKQVLQPPKTPLCVEIEPISLPTQIDPRVLVSKFTWAVTLVTYDGSLGNHAEIIVEGINDGYYTDESPTIRNAKTVGVGEKFIHLAHFLPHIESGLLSPNELIFETRTEIWMRTSSKVKLMLENIENEKSLPRGKRYEFNFVGKNTILPKMKLPLLDVKIGGPGQNCFTWARDHLKTVNIDLGESVLEPVAALSKRFTKSPEKYTEDPIQQI